MNPVLILADGVIGTMMEPVELPRDEDLMKRSLQSKRAKRNGLVSVMNLTMQIVPGSSQVSGIQRKCRHGTKMLPKMYASWEKDVMVEEYQIEDAEACTYSLWYLRTYLQICCRHAS